MDRGKRLIQFSLILLAAGMAGCGHEARITGPTQCFAPAGLFHHPKVARAGELVREEAALTARAETPRQAL